MMPSCGYLLCCIERTGSNLLANALSGTDLAGRPVEYFNPSEQDKPWMREILGDSTMVEALAKILSAGTTPNARFGAKVHWSHFQYLGMSINGEWDEWRAFLDKQRRSRLSEVRSQAPAPELLPRRFSDTRTMATAYASLRSWIPELRIIWLKRQNMIARAISHFRARQTGVWHQPISKGSEEPGNRVCNFDFQEIHTLYRQAAFQEESWRRFFEEHEITPHCVVYEELVADYESIVRRVIEFLDISDEQTPITPPLSHKQSDALSEEWEARYRKLSAEAET